MNEKQWIQVTHKSLLRELLTYEKHDNYYKHTLKKCRWKKNCTLHAQTSARHIPARKLDNWKQRKKEIAFIFDLPLMSKELYTWTLWMELISRIVTIRPKDAHCSHTQWIAIPCDNGTCWNFDVTAKGKKWAQSKRECFIYFSPYLHISSISY